MTVKARPNFRIVESSNYYDYDYDLFKKLFFDELVTVAELCSQMNITKLKYKSIKRRLEDDYGRKLHKSVCVKKRKQYDSIRYVTKCSARESFRVVKTIGNTQKFFGQYHDLAVALYVRDCLEAHNWDYDYYKQLRKQMEVVPLLVDEETYNQIKKDYLDGLQVIKICAKYDISQYVYQKISNKIKEEEGIEVKPVMKK